MSKSIMLDEYELGLKMLDLALDVAESATEAVVDWFEYFERLERFADILGHRIDCGDDEDE